MEEELHITCSADTRYVEHSAAMIHSALVNGCAKELHVHYLHGPDLARESARLLTAMVESLGGRISFLPIDQERVADLPGWQYIPRTMWYRAFLPELLPHVDRVLYLDVDTIVVDSLLPLWETDLSEHHLGAVTNVLQLNHMRRPAAVGLDDPRSYFNSGVLLMNLERMRGDDVGEKLLRYVRDHARSLEWPDQDALNAVLAASRLPLHPRWNCMNSVLRFPWSPYAFGIAAVREARRSPAIRHFEGPPINKPWHYLCDGEMKETYFEHRRGTPWPDVRLEGLTLRNVARRRRRELTVIARRGIRRARRNR